MDDEKAKKLKGKMDAFMADIALDMLDDSDIRNLERGIKGNLNKVGVGTNLPYLRAVEVGFQLALSCMQNVGSEGIAPVMAGLRHIVAQEEKKVKEISEKAGI